MVTHLKTRHILDFVPLQRIEDHCLCLRTGNKHDVSYHAVIAVSPVNFSLLSEQEQLSILESFRIFLARLPVYHQVRIHIRIEPYAIQPYLNRLEEASRTAPAALQEMGRDHQQFVQELATTRTLLQRRFLLIVGADRATTKQQSASDVFAQARLQLEQRTSDILADMERIGTTGYRLENLELLHYYQSCLQSQQARAYPLLASNVAALDRPVHHRLPRRSHRGGPETQSQQLVSSASAADMMHVPELLAPSALEVTSHYLRVTHHESEYARGYIVIGYPAQVQAGWFDRLIQFDEPDIDLLMQLEPLEAGTYITRLSRKMTGFQATLALDAKRGKVSDPYIIAAHQEVKALRQELVAQEEQVFGVALYVLVRASSVSQLKERSARLQSLLYSLELTAIETIFEHQSMWRCFLPGGPDEVKRRKVLTTSSVVTAFPFVSASLSTPTGVLRGVMPNGSLVIMDPSSDLLENGHEVKFARSGAGKSYDEKISISRALQMGYKVTVIDPENEYLSLVQAYQGVNVHLSSGALHLNPFDLPTSFDHSERNVLEEKFQSLHTLFDLLLAEKNLGMLSQKEKGYLNRVFAFIYADKSITLDPATHTLPPPTMHELYLALRSGICGPDTFELADRLQRYLTSFPATTTLALENPLVVFNIRDLAPELRAVGLFLVADFVWTQVRKQRRPEPRLLVIDEAWTLLQFPQGGRFLAGIARRARKYNLSLRAITQDVEDFLGSEWGRTILVNASMKFLMKQDESTIDAVTQAFKLSESERRYLLSAGKGEGLFFARSSHVPMKVVASAAEHRLATTNPQELLKEELAELQRRQQEVAASLQPEEQQNNEMLPTLWAAETEDMPLH